VIIVDYIIKSRSESFCAKRRSRGRQLGEAQKDLLLWMTYTILSSRGHKKNRTRTNLFSFAAVTVKWQFSNLQYSNFQAPVIPSSLVAILLILEDSIILVKYTKI
jgi:hypothetical protein